MNQTTQTAFKEILGWCLVIWFGLMPVMVFMIWVYATSWSVLT